MNRIVIAIPTRDECKARFAFDLVNLVAAQLQTGDTVIPMPSMGTLLASQRTALVKEAKRENATHILFLDSDMRFPADTLKRLLAHDVQVVGANCAKRRMPTGPTAANYDHVAGKVPVYTEEDSTGLEQVDMLGTGVLLVRMDVFEQIPFPPFATPWVPDMQEFMGEDTYFCMLLKRNQIPVFVDHDVSLEIGHLGEFEFKHLHTWAVREGMQQEKQWPLQPSVN